MKNPFRIVCIVLGFICLGLGSLGVVLPFLPSFPFFLATVFFFAKSSKRLHDWFLSTSLYKKHFQSYVERKAMTWTTKISILISLTLVFGTGFVMMKRVPMARVVLVVVWLCHVLYFIFGVKTLKSETC
ncbi:YbaN family protein [Treponema sp. OMZ 840]|uniref:YbaN family protein n=1 Tax=Treponema sp. OMZ 840 TaxID=244313 RepID=UPI003D8E3B86